MQLLHSVFIFVRQSLKLAQEATVTTQHLGKTGNEETNAEAKAVSCFDSHC